MAESWFRARTVATALYCGGVGLLTLSAVSATRALYRRRQRALLSKKSAPGPAAVTVSYVLPEDMKEVPERLRPSFYFDLSGSLEERFAHSELLTNAAHVVEVVGEIHSYIVRWLSARASNGIPLVYTKEGIKIVGTNPRIRTIPRTSRTSSGDNRETFFAPDVIIGRDNNKHTLHVGDGVQVFGGTFDLRAGSIWLDADSTVEPGAHIAGPAIFGTRTTFRAGAYVRGDVVTGDGVYMRGEIKNSVLMDGAELCHTSYVGDSLIGRKGHFGCQAVTANLGLFGAELSADISVSEGTFRRYKLGCKKMGVVLGDGSQLGCNSVTDPATFIAPRTHVYPLTRLAAGCYGPDEIVKNKPADCGVVTRTSMK